MSRDVWYAAFVAPAVGFLIWLAFHLYGELLDIQKELGAKSAHLEQVEDRKTTCVLVLTDDNTERCVFRDVKLKPPPP
jgi:hypothetical protein